MLLDNMEARMRKLAVVLTVLAAFAFLAASWRAVMGPLPLGLAIFGAQPETFWRATTGLLMFAIVLLMLERSQPK